MGVSQREMGNILSISPGSWRVAENGSSVPGGQTLIRLAELGFDTNWILTGKGNMRLEPEQTGLPEKLQAPFKTASKAGQERSEQPVNPHEVYRATVTTSGVDPELLGRVTGMVATLYRQHGKTLSHADAAKTAAPYYDRLRGIAVTGDEDERLALLGILRVWLEKDLTTTASDFDNSKASA